MSDVDVVAQAIRVAESGDNYTYQQLASVEGERIRKVGAYGMLDKRWTELSEAAGYAGANWRDRSIQDRIAKEKLRQDFEKYGDWSAAVIAFRFGGQAAEAYVKRIDHPASQEVDTYLKNVKRRMSNKERKVIGSVSTSDREKNPNLTRAEKVIRDKVVMMRDSQARGVDDGRQGNEELVTDGDQGVPGEAQ